jgi:carbonic anhydrase
MTFTHSRRIAALLSASLFALFAAGRTAAQAAHPAEAHHAPHWSYHGEGGPGHWASLEAAFAACGTGKSQSPIDLMHATPSDIPNVSVHYEPSLIDIINNGHTIQVNYAAGSYIEVDGVRYDLVQFHFHAPSEHLVNGKRYDAELHLVHKNGNGELAVIGVLIEKGADNAAFATVWSALPAKEGPEHTLSAQTDATAMLPAVQTTYRYSGSLTTPPCTEGVKWIVMTAPVQMSAAQLAAFTKIIDGNDRPVQPLGARTLVEDTSP